MLLKSVLSRKQKLRFFTLAMAICLVQTACGAESGTRTTARPDQPSEAPNMRAENMKIRIRTSDKVVTAILNDNNAARDFVSLLPLTLTLEDYANTEKISYLPRKLSTEGAPAGSDPDVGDIAYYAPWGNLAIYYKDFGYSNGLILLGKIDGDLEALTAPGAVTVTIELVKSERERSKQ